MSSKNYRQDYYLLNRILYILYYVLISEKQNFDNHDIEYQNLAWFDKQAK